MLFAAAVIVVVVVVAACIGQPRNRTRVGEAVRAIKTGNATPPQRRVVAGEAQRRGLAIVAEDLYTQADIQSEIDRWSQNQRSPLAGVSDRQWGAWLEANEQPSEVASRHAERSPLYGLRERELDDVNIERPASEAEEYTAFVCVTRSLLRSVAERFGTIIGTEIEGQTATLSGLLAVARCAGLGGLATWVNDAGERSKFGRTTQAYKRATGLF